jgi:anaerobic magnesium-protoporphyrin IX monomethyl ester cyclase
VWAQKMRVLLIRPYWLLLPEEMLYTPTEPLGLEYLAAVIRDNHQVCIYDAIAGDGYPKLDRKLFVDEDGTNFVHFGVSLTRILEKIESFRPEVVGVTAQFFSQDRAVKTVCRIVKDADKGIRVIAGGSSPSALKEKFLEDNPNVDIIVIGEGEVTLKELLDNKLENLSSVKGIAFRDEGRIVCTPPRPLISDLDSIPFPARDLTPYAGYAMSERPLFMTSRTLNYFVSLPIVSRFHDSFVNSWQVRRGRFKIPRGHIITSKGCPMNCNFCVVHNVWGHKIRMRSPENIMSEVELLVRKYGRRHIEIVDDNFNFSKERVIEICKRLEPLKITWRPSSGVFVPSLDREVLTWMKRSGCNYLTVAIENGNQNTLKNIIGKNINLDHVKKILRICNELSIKTEGFFILGLPGETKGNMIETIKFAATCGVDAARLYIAVPFPGSRLYDECVKKGYLTEYYDFSRLQVTPRRTNIRAAVIKTNEFSPDEVIKLRTIGYKVLEERNFDKYAGELEAV